MILQEDDGCTGILRDKIDPVRRVIRIERDVSRAYFENGDNRRHQLKRAFHEETDQRTSADLGRCQIGGDLLGPSIQLSIGQTTGTQG